MAKKEKQKSKPKKVEAPKYSPSDCQHAKNIVLALKRAEFNGFTGEEMIAFNQSIAWLIDQFVKNGVEFKK